MTQTESFLLGMVAITCLTAGVFFLKFWRRTDDLLFAAFAAFFLIEGANRVALFFLAKPNEGDPLIYVVRLIALVLVLSAIVKKNSDSRG